MGETWQHWIGFHSYSFANFIYIEFEGRTIGASCPARESGSSAATHTHKHHGRVGAQSRLENVFTCPDASARAANVALHAQLESDDMLGAPSAAICDTGADLSAVPPAPHDFDGELVLKTFEFDDQDVGFNIGIMVCA